MTVIKHLFVCASLVLSLATGTARACDDQDADGMDVALVLSGGGAFATTHIGALELIEEMEIPIHCIVGTSMGSVVGGLYVAGYDVADMEKIFTDSDWGEIFSGVIKRSNKPYLEKENEGQYFSDYVASITKDGVQFPGGWREMRGLKAHFRKLTTHLNVNEDFNTLRVPYRAVATDLSTGEAVAFSEGDITEAMLASMAVPGAFAPRNINGRLYVDGGLASQLPIKIAKAMGADIIIALDTTIEPPEVNGAPSLGDTTAQLVRITVWRNWKEEVALLSEQDVMIRPSLEGLTVSSFERAQQGFEAGRVAAQPERKKLEAIKKLAAPSRMRTIDPSRRRSNVSELLVVNESRIKDDAIRRRFSFREEDLSNPEKIDRKLKDLAAFGGFGEVNLGFQGDAAVLDIRERNLKGVLLQAGLQASSTFDGDSTYGVLGRLSYRPFSAHGGEARLAFQLGSDFGVMAELYQPLGPKGQFFVMPAIGYTSEEIIFDLGNIRLGEFVQKQGTGRLRFGRELGQWGVIGFEGVVATGRLDPQITISPDVAEGFDYSLGGGGALLGVDTLDKIDWPTRGFQFHISGQALFDFSDGERTNVYRLFAMKPLKVSDLGVILRAKTESVQNDNNDPIEVLSLGGFRQLSAFSENSIPNNEYVLGSVEVFKRLTAADTVVNFPLYLGATVEYANVSFELFGQTDNDHFASGSVYLGAETIFGPAFLGAGFAEEGQYSLFLHLGRSF